MQFWVSSYDEVSSTNDEIIAAIARGEAEGVAVCARSQTAGRGRQGRTWLSPQGGLYLSMLLRPQQANPSTLTLVAGLAVQQLLHILCPQVMLKWPNDIVVPLESATDDGLSYGKLCGILAEGKGDAICLGLGLNVRRPEEPLETGDITPVFLEDLVPNCPTNIELRSFLLDEIGTLYDLWQNQGFEPFVEAFDAANILVGKEVTITDETGSLLAAGQVLGTASDGRLQLQLPTGETQFIASGEAHLSR